MSEDDKQVKTQVFTLGEIILKLEMPDHFVEAINKSIDFLLKSIFIHVQPFEYKNIELDNRIG